MKTAFFLLLVVLAAGCRSADTLSRQARRDPDARLGTANRRTITESPTIEHATPRVPPAPPTP